MDTVPCQTPQIGVAGRSWWSAVASGSTMGVRVTHTGSATTIVVSASSARMSRTPPLAGDVASRTLLVRLRKSRQTRSVPRQDDRLVRVSLSGEEVPDREGQVVLDVRAFWYIRQWRLKRRVGDARRVVEHTAVRAEGKLRIERDRLRVS